jgi:signal transduction histidine kinase
MKRWVAGSLRRKLVALVLLTTLVALLLAMAAIVAYDLADYRRLRLADASTNAELIGQSSAPALAFDDPRSAQENLDLLRLRPLVQAAAIYTPRGALFASYRRGDGEAAVPPLPGAEGVSLEGDSMTLVRRIVRDGEIVGTVYLRSDDEFGRRLLDYSLIGLGAIAAALLLAVLLSAPLRRMVVRPVLEVAALARQVMAEGDYSRRARKLSDDEVGLLADSFNGMLGEIERRTAELEVSNRALADQIAERTRAEQRVSQLNAELEDRVAERTAQLEAANRELEAFSYSVSHDLRAPLRAIDGFSQALVEDFPDDVPEEARRYLARIRHGTARMGQLIEDLLNLSRLSRGTLVRTEVDVTEMARQIVEELRQHEPARQVEVSVWDRMEAQAEAPLLRAALANLIGNAWKFTSRVEHPRIEVGAMRDGARRVYFVRDNGAGFDPKFSDKLFVPFQRLHGTHEFSGTGIGLATVQRIVHRHGGRIWADAQVGRGAAFYFTLDPGPAEPLIGAEAGGA